MKRGERVNCAQKCMDYILMIQQKDDKVRKFVHLFLLKNECDHANSMQSMIDAFWLAGLQAYGYRIRLSEVPVMSIIHLSKIGVGHYCVLVEHKGGWIRLFEPRFKDIWVPAKLLHYFYSGKSIITHRL
ncbi:MAG: hypothetical protein ACRDBX_01305 [Erysipelotrichaceae bacterium]